MIDNTLTAKEWLDENNIDTFFPITSIIDPLNLTQMEKYADYKTKMLEGKILEFRNKIKDFQFLSIYDEDKLIDKFDKHFNIKKETQGKID